MILEVCFCLLGLALAVLGILLLLRPKRFRRVEQRLDQWAGKLLKRQLAWSRLAGSLFLLMGTVLFVVLLVSLLVQAAF